MISDSISHRGHSVTIRSTDKKFTRCSKSLWEVETIKVGPSGLSHIDEDPKEREIISDCTHPFDRKAREIIIDPESIERNTLSADSDRDITDQLKQLGYVE
jgi:hypothetical protein